MKRVSVIITVEGPRVDPESPEASAFLDLVEQVWDTGMGELAIMRGLGNYVSGWHFQVDGGETRYMPEESEGGAE